VTEEELSLMQEMRWWSVAEMEATTERLFPADIAALAQDIWTVTGQADA
jgi:hypothetical protein